MMEEFDEFQGPVEDNPGDDLEAILDKLEEGVEIDESEQLIDTEMEAVVDADANERLFDMLFVTHAGSESIARLFEADRKPNPNLVDLDEQRPYQRTALTRLIASGRYDLAETLMELGADPNYQQDGEVHPFTVLCHPDEYRCKFGGMNEVARVLDRLFQSNATNDTRDENGRTPFEHAVKEALRKHAQMQFELTGYDEYKHYEGIVKGLSIQVAQELASPRHNPQDSLRTSARMATRDGGAALDAFREIILRTDQVLAACGIERKDADGELYSPTYLSLIHCPHKSFEEMGDHLSHYKISDVQDLSDVLDEFSTYVLIPAMYLESDTRTRSKLGKTDKIYPLVEKLRPIAFKYLFGNKSIDAVFGISKGWHQPRYFFPQALRPLADGEWHAIIGDQKIPEQHDLGGYKVRCLNSSALLKEEGNVMNHCIGGQDNQCLEGSMHAFSIRDADGNPVSTFDVSIIDIDEYKRTSPNKEECIVVDKIAGPVLQLNEHKGHGNDAPSDQAKRVFAWLKEQVEKMGIEVKHKNVGETDSSASKRARSRASSLEKMVGFRMTESNLRTAFAHFQTVRGKRPKDDGGFKDTKDRLIAGNYQPFNESGEATGPPEPYRRMDASEWLEKKGIYEKLAAVTNKLVA